nr:unnamed protein product [Spirometra erinaceieuropaei]
MVKEPKNTLFNYVRVVQSLAVIQIKRDYQQLSCELLWRFARTCRWRILTEGVSDKKLKASLIKEGLAATKYAVEKYPKNANCNTWYGIFLDLEGQQEGIKKRIENAYKVKEYFQKAVELDETDYATLHALGICAPPTSSYEEALGYFLKAENVKPMALANNVCRIAQCYAKTGQGDKAKEYAAKVLEFTGMDEETKEAKKEAQYILAH